MFIDVMRAAIEAVEAGHEGVLCTVLDHQGSAPGKTHHKMLVLANGQHVGTVGGGSLEALVLERAQEVIQRREATVESFRMLPTDQGGTGAICGGTVRVVLELLPNPPRVLICGAGHVGLELARTLAQIGYPHEVHDDRAELVAQSAFPEATVRWSGPIEATLETLGGLGRFSHVVLVSRGHDTDRHYGRVIAGSGYDRWFGMMGSKRKAVLVKRAWVEEDGLAEAQVAAIESPVGVAIGGSSPAEIAISISARIIQVSNIA